MKKRKIKYTDEPMELEAIEDFLPSPKDLVLKEDNIKVTLELSRKSINFFKKQAEKQNVSYQRMIRSLIDLYSDKYC